MNVGISNGTQSISANKRSLRLTTNIRQQFHGVSLHSSGKDFHHITKATKKNQNNLAEALVLD